jgi:hypothetical protein
VGLVDFTSFKVWYNIRSVKNDENQSLTERNGRFKKLPLLIGGWCFPLDDLEFKPEIFEFERNNQPVKVTLVHPIEDLVIAGKDLSSASKGQDILLPRWAAEELIQTKIAVNRDEVKLDYKDFDRTLSNEQLQTPLQKLPDDFYGNAKKLMESLLQKAGETKDPENGRIVTQFDALIRDIVSVRMSKILKVAFRGDDSLGVISLMTDEEVWLYRRLTKLLKTWEKGMLGRLR